MKTSKALAVLACMFAASLAAAQTQTVEDRTAVMDAQISLVKKKKELQDALRDLAGTSASGLPVVVSVTIGSERVARLQLQNGIVGHYREGEFVRPGMVVSSIAPKQVFVAIGKGKDSSVIALDFAGPVVPGAQVTPKTIPDALLPSAPTVSVPAIEVIPDAKPVAKPTAASASQAAPKAGK